MSIKRKIIAVTGARSEYDILYPILKAIQKFEDITLKVIVTGAHLSESYGKTVNLIEKDNFEICGRIYNLIDSNQKIGRIISLGNQISHLANILENEKPDIVMVVGDREEAITTSMTCAYMDIVCVHIAGGDIAKDGNIDNSVRYATSKFAHIHFTILENHKETLLKLGEDEWRIFHIGNPALDRFINCEYISLDELSQKLGTTIEAQNYFVLIQHPVISTVEREKDYIIETLEALVEKGVKTFINYPNSDAGNQSIIEVIEKYKEKYDFLFTFKNLDRVTYINLLRNAKILLGNSSSGIIETPSLGLPAINIGIRQLGRTNAGNVIFVKNDRKQILSAINEIMSDPEIHNKILTTPNPYGNGNSGEKAAKLLREIQIDKNLIYKNITY